jgi:pimeloyl-ACP methyl ester carboxylesterase
MNEKLYREAESKLWTSVGLQPTETRVRLKSTNSAVRVQVVGEGPDVLFLHGGPNSGSTWAGMLEHFPGYRCYLLDRPGTGLSEDYSLAEGDLETVADAFVADTLDALELDSAHVVASSFGGYLALRSAAKTPERFQRMVQMACPAMAPGMKTPKFMKMMRFRFFRWLVPKLPPTQKANDDIMRQIGHGASIDSGKFPEVFSDWYLALQRYTNTMKNELTMIGTAVGKDGFDPSITIPDELLRSVSTPTHFLWGEDDGFGGADVANHLVEQMPNATVQMYPESGHLPWLDDPKTIAEATSAFLGK